ncbi:MAG TPA: trypsin-like peptidase domain-containing protein [Candidatus Bathyarchaeia archaeon]|nr:trypsin-like peptidase domain-containing protein [Candidatus Bathyarchaeia archaeon]
MEPTTQRNSASFLILLFAAGLLVGGFVTFYISYVEVNNLRDDVAVLESQLSSVIGNQNVTYQDITVYQDSAALATIYSNVRESVVLIQGTTSDGGVQGSGFVYRFANRNVVITNYHVVEGTESVSVTFSNGHGYAATVLGSDAYADLAVVSVDDAPADEFKPVEIVSSSSLRVGDQVIAIGNPYGLVGSATTGIVSAVGRTITENSAGGFAIANVIQTSAPINPGNSGGPLLNVLGNVVGITTAIVSDSQGLGFAVPSNTILREISSLISIGTYRGHSYMGVTGSDMSYALAQGIGSSVTYGWRLASITRGGPSDGRLNVNDIIIAMNGTQIRNNDDLASFLEEKTLPNENLVITVMRDNTESVVTIVLGTRPAPQT